MWHICDVSSEKVPEPPYVNNEKIAKTRPKVNFDDFLFLAQMTSYQPKNGFCEFGKKYSTS